MRDVYVALHEIKAQGGFVIQQLNADKSYEKIRRQILLLNPTAEEKTVCRG